jgi:hypothetical protein
MKICVDRNVVELNPENVEETSALECLWRILIDCVGESKRLTPIGEYIPNKRNLARFTIEGVPGGRTVMSDQTATEDCTYLCTLCNKYSNVKAGEPIPLCCGMTMVTSA